MSGSELRELLEEMEGHIRSDSSYPVSHIRAKIESLFNTRPSGWIRCEDRLPEKAGEYITTSLRWSDSQDYSVEWSYFNSKLREWELPTIAWMENPAPYAPPSDGGKG